MNFKIVGIKLKEICIRAFCNKTFSEVIFLYFGFKFLKRTSIKGCSAIRAACHTHIYMTGTHISCHFYILPTLFSGRFEFGNLLSSEHECTYMCTHTYPALSEPSLYMFLLLGKCTERTSCVSLIRVSLLPSHK